MFWTKVKSFFKKVWEFIKKIPIGLWVALLLVGAVGYYLFRRFYLQKQIVDIQNERRLNENVKNEAIENTLKEEKEEIERIKEEYEEREKALDREEEELIDSASKGPSAIAKEWQEYWSNRK